MAGDIITERGLVKKETGGIMNKKLEEGGQENMVERVNEHQAAKFLGLSVQTLRNWRSFRKGPAYLKLGRRVVYQVKDLNRYLDSHRIDPSKN